MRINAKGKKQKKEEEKSMLRSSLSSCSVGIFRRAPAISYSLRNAGEVRAGGGAYAEKERTQENFAVTQKDAELLKKLRETLKLEVIYSLKNNLQDNNVEI